MFVDQVQRNRFELKYLIDERCARTVRDFARSYLVRDRYARPEMAFCYPIYSVYLDSPDLAIYRTTTEGWRNRFKLRMRYYDENPANPVFCEIKRRANDVILKERARVKRSSGVKILFGYPPEKSDLFDEDDLDSFSSLQRFCELQRSLNAYGRTFVGYIREAWNAPDDTGVRLTFDYRIRGAWYAGSLVLPQQWTYPRLEFETVMELKFTTRFPTWMRELVHACNLTRQSMAKYVRCVEALGAESRLRGWSLADNADDDDD